MVYIFKLHAKDKQDTSKLLKANYMNNKQKKILEKAVKTKLKNEMILTGSSKYINPIRKPSKKKG